jgi:hypothetical protein
VDAGDGNNMSSYRGMNGNEVHTRQFKCGICGKIKECWESNDIHNTYAVCQQCAKDNDMEHCKYCGNMRFPENLDRLDPQKFTGKGGFCPGCLDEAVDIIISRDRITAPKIKKTTTVKKKTSNTRRRK